jgi:hypothetical protein
MCIPATSLRKQREGYVLIVPTLEAGRNEKALALAVVRGAHLGPAPPQRSADPVHLADVDAAAASAAAGFVVLL